MANSVRETIRRNPMRPTGFDLFNQPEFSTQSEVRMSQALHYASRRIDVTKRSTYLNIWVSSEEVYPCDCVQVDDDEPQRPDNSEREDRCDEGFEISPSTPATYVHYPEDA